MTRPIYDSKQLRAAAELAKLQRAHEIYGLVWMLEQAADREDECNRQASTVKAQQEQIDALVGETETPK